jgi:transposase
MTCSLKRLARRGLLADRGMISEATIAQIKQRHWKYIVGVSYFIDARP